MLNEISLEKSLSTSGTYPNKEFPKGTVHDDTWSYMIIHDHLFLLQPHFRRGFAMCVVPCCRVPNLYNDSWETRSSRRCPRDFDLELHNPWNLQYIGWFLQLLVGGLEHLAFMTFQKQLGMENHPNCYSLHGFSEGLVETTNQIMIITIINHHHNHHH